MMINDLLRWLLRMVQPFYGWRVPVVLLRGTARGGSGQATLLIAGRKQRTIHIKERFFEAEPQVERTARVPVWFVQKLLNEWQSSADMTVVEIDRISARLFLDKNYLAAPPYVASWMPVPDDLKVFARHHGHAAADMQKVRNRPFESSLSHEASDFDLFYDRFHVPYISRRHGDEATLVPRWYWRRVFKRGGILWVSYDGERVAGDLVMVRKSTFHKVINGLVDGRMELLRLGALAALYVHAIHQAKKSGCSKIFQGGSRSSLHDGVLRYKCKWGGVICSYDEGFSSHFVSLYRWNRLEGAVACFLSHTSLIHHDADGFSALWAFPRGQPLTCESLTKEYQSLKAAGLRRFYILINGEVPSGFDCPPEVRLIDARSIDQRGTEALLHAEIAVDHIH